MSHLLQLKMTLLGSKPPIWRRVTINDVLTFYDLHSVIQSLMNWDNSHLHEFDLKNGITINDNDDYGYNDSMFDFGGRRRPLVGSDEKLGMHLTKEKQKLFYTYDFGDSWKLEIEVEAIILPKPEDKSVTCLSGKRNAPPEDSGGVWSYMAAIEDLKNKKSPNYRDLIEFYGDDFDPEYFDLVELNKKFKGYKKIGQSSKAID